MPGPTKANALKCLQRALSGAHQVRGLQHENSEFEKWKTSTIQVLNRILGHESSQSKDFDRSLIVGRHENIGTNVDRAISLLTSLIEEVEEDWPEAERVSDSPNNDFGVSRNSNKVFIVHGHDESARESVARFLDRLELEPVILHEQPNRGRTIIEKFESYADVGFAVVLLTPDDVGASAENKDKLQPRARQNVIFELGFFIGRLGRQRVCALVDGDVETPSDYDGVVYTKLNDGGGWRLKLLQELKAAGLDIDPDRAL